MSKLKITFNTEIIVEDEVFVLQKEIKKEYKDHFKNLMETMITDDEDGIFAKVKNIKMVVIEDDETNV